MRSNVIEKLLKGICEAHRAGRVGEVDNLVTKAQIVMDRSSTEDASVIREVLNQ